MRREVPALSAGIIGEIKLPGLESAVGVSSEAEFSLEKRCPQSTDEPVGRGCKRRFDTWASVDIVYVVNFNERRLTRRRAGGAILPRVELG